MITFETTEFINRPPQDVFAFLADPANYGKYQANTVSTEWLSPAHFSTAGFSVL